MAQSQVAESEEAWEETREDGNGQTGSYRESRGQSGQVRTLIYDFFCSLSVVGEIITWLGRQANGDRYKTHLLSELGSMVKCNIGDSRVVTQC